MGTYHLLIVSRTRGDEGWKALRAVVENPGQTERWAPRVAFVPVRVLSSPGTRPLLPVASPNRTFMHPVNDLAHPTLTRGSAPDQGPRLRCPDLLAFSARLIPLYLCPVACRLRDGSLDQIDTSVMAA